MARPLSPPARPVAAVALALALALGATACGGAGVAAPPEHRRIPPSTTTTVAPTTTTRAAVAPEEAVRRAYLQSWDDYAWAVWNLDPGRLESTYADDELARIRGEIQRLTAARHRTLVDVTHDVTVLMIGDTRASVVDRTVEASVDYDADTRVAVEARTPHDSLFQMLLEKIDGHWKVVFNA